jgi:hypothetical protein
MNSMSKRVQDRGVAWSVAAAFVGLFGLLMVAACGDAPSTPSASLDDAGSTLGPGDAAPGASDASGEPATPASDATLSALTVSGATLAPAFAPDALSYATVARFSSVVTATTRDPAATLTIAGAPALSGIQSGPLPISAPSTEVKVVVTARDGITTRQYALSIAWTANDYLKASNTRQNGIFGGAVALSADGTTLAVGAEGESSAATGIGGAQSDTSAPYSGAVYVFTRSGGAWTQQAYVKASNARASAGFGRSVALSADGSTLAVGAYFESSAATGVGGDQSDTSAQNAGAAYVFTRTGGSWSQQAYLKASNARAGARFGDGVALSGDGSTLAVGSSYESSNATGVGGNQSDTSKPFAGAVYVFARSASTWSQQAYVKASHSTGDQFGARVALSADGSTLAAGAVDERSKATGIGGDQLDTSAGSSGAVFVFSKTAGGWVQQAYVKASNTRGQARFGSSVALAGDGSVLAVGSAYESSAATGVAGNQSDTTAPGSGAIYVFARAAGVWTQEAYVKASNSGVDSAFGWAAALSGDGQSLVVGAGTERSAATGLNGTQTDTSAPSSGAAYLFTRTGGAWSQRAYIKASNTRANALFGKAVAISTDGNTIAVGSATESSGATGVGGSQADQSVPSGAVYVF